MLIRQLKIPILIVVFLSFALGLAWGVKLQRDRAVARGSLKSSSLVRILTYHGILSHELITEFENQTGIQVVLTEAQNPEDLWDRLEAAPPEQGFDLFSVMSYQLPLATQLARVEKPDVKDIPSLSAVSPDLRNIPGDLNHENVVPVLWGMTGLLVDRKRHPAPPDSWGAALEQASATRRAGLLNSTIDIARLTALEGNPAPEELKRRLGKLLTTTDLSQDFLSAASFFMGPEAPSILQINHGESAFPPANADNWQFVWPKERATMWILSYALVRDLPHTSEAHRFLEFLLSREAAMEMVRTSHQASANRRAEETALDGRLKPSYFRQIGLALSVMPNDFSRAREVRKQINDQAVMATPTPKAALGGTPDKRAGARPTPRAKKPTAITEE